MPAVRKLGQEALSRPQGHRNRQEEAPQQEDRQQEDPRRNQVRLSNRPKPIRAISARYRPLSACVVPYTNHKLKLPII